MFLCQCGGEIARTVADVLATADPALFDGEAPLKPVIARLMSGEPAAAILPDLHDPGVQRTVSAVVARDELYTADQAALAMAQSIWLLERPRREARIAALEQRMSDLRQQGDVDGRRAAAREHQQLIQSIHKIERALRSGDLQAWLAYQDRSVTGNS